MKTIVYIYAVPVITVITSVLILHEKFTAATALGTILTLAGLLISERKEKKNENRKSEMCNADQ